MRLDTTALEKGPELLLRLEPHREAAVAVTDADRELAALVL